MKFCYWKLPDYDDKFTLLQSKLLEGIFSCRGTGSFSRFRASWVAPLNHSYSNVESSNGYTCAWLFTIVGATISTLMHISHQNSEVLRVWTREVSGWVTSCEIQVLHPSFTSWEILFLHPSLNKKESYCNYSVNSVLYYFVGS